MWRKWMFIIVLISAIVVSGVGASSAQSDSMDEIVLDYMNKGQIPGATVVVVDAQGQSSIRNYGYSNIRTGEKVTADTSFGLASLSKAFTGLAVTNLIEEGKLGLDDPVDRYIPWFQVTFQDKPAVVTVRHLLEHSSGFATEDFLKIPSSIAPDALESGIKTISGSQLRSAPGETYQYSNVNYDILGLLIEVVSGQTYSEYMMDQVFEPLNITKTGIFGTHEIEHRSIGYKLGFLKAKEYDLPLDNSQSPSFSVMMNGQDMSRWMQINLGFIDTERNLRTIQLSDDNKHHYYVGWEIDAERGILQHTGNLQNFSSMIILDMVHQSGVAVLANLNSSYTVNIGTTLMAMMRGEGDSESYMDMNQIIDRVSVILLLISVVGIVWLLRLITIHIQRSRLNTNLHPGRIRNAWVWLLAGVLITVVGSGVITLPGIVMPGADWRFMNEWLPSSTKYGAYSLALLLTTLIIFISTKVTSRRAVLRKLQQ